MEILTRQREHLKVPHRAQVLQTKVTHLRTPAQEKGGQGQHRGNVTHTDVGDVDAPGTERGKGKVYQTTENWVLRGHIVIVYHRLTTVGQGKVILFPRREESRLIQIYSTF